MAHDHRLDGEGLASHGEQIAFLWKKALEESCPRIELFSKDPESELWKSLPQSIRVTTIEMLRELRARVRRQREDIEEITSEFAKRIERPTEKLANFSVEAEQLAKFIEEHAGPDAENDFEKYPPL